MTPVAVCRSTAPDRMVITVAFNTGSPAAVTVTPLITALLRLLVISVDVNFHGI